MPLSAVWGISVIFRFSEMLYDYNFYYLPNLRQSIFNKFHQGHML